eukprot:3941956-Rhodomonas_salina.5
MYSAFRGTNTAYATMYSAFRGTNTAYATMYSALRGTNTAYATTYSAFRGTNTAYARGHTPYTRTGTDCATTVLFVPRGTKRALVIPGPMTAFYCEFLDIDRQRGSYVISATLLRACYALSGTGLCAVRYGYSVWSAWRYPLCAIWYCLYGGTCYAMSGTDALYGTRSTP